jgi:hypothetical protein
LNPGESERTNFCGRRPSNLAREFAEWTAANRLRHAKFMGVRQDQAPQEVNTSRDLLVQGSLEVIHLDRFEFTVCRVDSDSRSA